ncbi:MULTISPECIES: hypothetical protein [Mycobacterium]|uniref:Uncharacterized protein n=1 Tax=Mycobacterium kiyosense TaxID=2871094 RepID=A0A9P3Q8C2_9MYCO|nr:MULTISPECIES: hypothetical protein [Mycobacterium]BDB45449.1 hypothetical protein IWGMT90018_58950 [Mycobacterium kiyosense]BDE16906.1 hypothetical protein MKCMC460_57660 [Mycobacterium sp. 20KCMC460]GLB84431.1 hypothetical protein SRL2020028_36870 [Mycobacterium kiyosense]GLB91062.1 hypothetical protein SRL2020130_38790 [Mycobacterium kiyosense]GLB96938.1 hypothetical protein SRL2020226_37140 [Mycobacterium kiyosense]
MGHIATDTAVHGPVPSSESEVPTVTLPGLAAAGVWAVGLIVGVVALLTGHLLVAGVALVLAIMAPWFGMAWVSRGRSRESNGWSAVHAPAR